MALPGVRTVLNDRFYSLSRTDLPDGITVAAIARRANIAGDPRLSGDGNTPPDYDPYRVRSEQDVIDAYGEDSELHRAYVELVAGGAARIQLIPIPAHKDDSDLASESDIDGENPLELAMGAVEAIQADIVVPWARGSDPLEWESPATPGNDPPNVGFVADNSASPGDSFALRVAQYCKEITDRSNPCFAVMGVNPYQGDAQSNGGLSPGDLATHLEFPNLIDHNAEEMKNYGPYLSVIAAEVRPTRYPATGDPQRWGFANGAATYAGMISAMNSENAPTGRRIFNVRGLRYVPTRPQQEALIEKGVVPVRLNFERMATITDGRTFANDTSDFVRLSTLRIVFSTVSLIRNTCQSYIGLPATIEHRASMETAISDRLRQITIRGILNDSDFTVTYVPRENKAIIDLVLRPAFELRNIEIAVSIDL